MDYLLQVRLDGSKDSRTMNREADKKEKELVKVIQDLGLPYPERNSSKPLSPISEILQLKNVSLDTPSRRGDVLSPERNKQ